MDHARRPVHGGPPDGADKRAAGARRCACRSSALGHSRAWELIGGGAKGRGECGELISSLTRARAAVWRSGDGIEAMMGMHLIGGGAQAQRKEKEGGSGCGGGR
jgi:hypothetical protein